MRPSDGILALVGGLQMSKETTAQAKKLMQSAVSAAMFDVYAKGDIALLIETARLATRAFEAIKTE